MYFSTDGSSGRPAVVLLHGFMGSSADWHDLIQRLRKKFYFLAFDLPGHGRSVHVPEPALWSLENTASRIAAILQEQGLTESHLIGYSMGGRLALRLALHYPQLFCRVILESTSPGLASASARRERRQQDKQLAIRLETSNFEQFLREWYEQPLFGNLRHRPGFMEMIARRRQNDVQALGKSLREMGTGAQQSLWDDWKGMSLPVLMMIGEQDSKYLAIATEMARCNARSQMKIFAGCAHDIHTAAPAEFAAAVEMFLQG